jgi:putative SOS response-associated peptidase YedK
VFWIITTPPNPVFAEYHNRQPVILDHGDYDVWLSTSGPPPLHLLRVFPEDKMVIEKVADPKETKVRAKSNGDDGPTQAELFN